MIEVLSTADGLVSIRVSGKVEKQEWEQVTTAVEEALSEHEQVSLYANLSELEGMSAGAIIEDLRTSLKNLTNMDQVGRLAVVTESAWIEKMIDASKKLFSDLDARVFSQDEVAEARLWVEPQPT
ncbi:SpoIIAA family protein [Nesterenkonia ebinurensis]|uniref:STAS/SEC14 domain-containing protein n=1 Tax=Nesterenkonia ebinurensis TaxID=2608252 RepID=UPI00123CD769|nr:STAS/SEC14 domain-containing protein [Nesterenkonia ebinurensis]